MSGWHRTSARASPASINLLNPGIDHYAILVGDGKFFVVYPVSTPPAFPVRFIISGVQGRRPCVADAQFRLRHRELYAFYHGIA